MKEGCIFFEILFCVSSMSTITMSTRRRHYDHRRFVIDHVLNLNLSIKKCSLFFGE